MSDNIFIDTNILIYAIDDNDISKQKISNDIIRRLSENGGVISTQVLQEFFNIATKKLQLSNDYVRQLLQRLVDCFKVHRNSESDIFRAIDISSKTQFSFWDSLIISAAIAEKCNILYSEDLNNGQLVESLKIINPLKN
ncbi:MAG: PIN domain-containing protein [Spirochaetales bacterium]|nr:PIN domain-containing protein [Spirochaetales bacterium]